MQNVNGNTSRDIRRVSNIVSINPAPEILDATAAVRDVGGVYSEIIPRKKAKKWAIHGLNPNLIIAGAIITAVIKDMLLREAVQDLETLLKQKL